MQAKRFGIILSAGYGKRLNSELPKGMYPLFNKPFIEYVLDTFNELKLDKTVVVLGYKKEEFYEILKKYNCEFAVQEELNGTAKAVESCSSLLKDLEGSTLITPVDTPKVSKDLYNDLFKFHEENNNDLTILSYEIEDPTSLGRIVRENSEFKCIKEEKDANENELKIKEVNSSIYIVNNQRLYNYIIDINNNNKSKEYYLTDLATIFKENGLKVMVYKTDKTNELLSVNDMEMFTALENAFRR